MNTEALGLFGILAVLPVWTVLILCTDTPVWLDKLIGEGWETLLITFLPNTFV